MNPSSTQANQIPIESQNIRYFDKYGNPIQLEYTAYQTSDPNTIVNAEVIQPPTVVYISQSREQVNNPHYYDGHQRSQEREATTCLGTLFAVCALCLCLDCLF
jgi:hypothetical protein